MSRRSRTFPVFLLAALVALPAAAADTWVVDRSHAEVSFQVRHLMVKVRGHFQDFEANIQADAAKPEASSVVFTVKTASINTSNEGRDKHLRSADFFDVENHPEMTFKSSAIKATGKDTFDVAGTLTIRGISKEIVLPVTFQGFLKDPWGKEKAGFETSVTLNRKDFGMVWNKALDAGGVVLGDEVWVNITFEAVKQTRAAAN
jgi:polyisoprenoid-binding protein YceI